MGAGIIGVRSGLRLHARSSSRTVPTTSASPTRTTSSAAMANVIVGIPVGGQHGAGFRPYVGGRRRADEDATSPTPTSCSMSTTTTWGLDLGVGAMGFMTDHVGFRGDVRYFRDLQNTGATRTRASRPRGRQLRLLARHRRSRVPLVNRSNRSDRSDRSDRSTVRHRSDRSERSPNASTSRTSVGFKPPQLFPPIAVRFERHASVQRKARLACAVRAARAAAADTACGSRCSTLRVSPVEAIAHPLRRIVRQQAALRGRSAQTGCTPSRKTPPSDARAACRCAR